MRWYEWAAWIFAAWLSSIITTGPSGINAGFQKEGRAAAKRDKCWVFRKRAGQSPSGI